MIPITKFFTFAYVHQLSWFNRYPPTIYDRNDIYKPVKITQDNQNMGFVVEYKLLSTQPNPDFDW